MQSGNLDQLNDLRGLEDCGTFFFDTVTLAVVVDEESGVPNVGGGGPGGGGGAAGGAGGGGGAGGARVITLVEVAISSWESTL